MADLPKSGGKKRKRKLLFLALKVVIAAGILAFIIRKAGVRNVWGAIRQIDPRLFSIGVLAYCCEQAVSSYRLSILLRAIDCSISYIRLYAIYFIGMFFNTLLPTLVGGDAVRIGYLYSETRRLDRAAAGVLVERTTGVAALITIALAGLAFAPRQDLHPTIVISVAVMTAAFLGGVLLLVSPWVYRVGTRCMHAVGLGKLEEEIRGFQDAIRTFCRKRRVLLYAYLLSFAVELIVVSVYALLAYGLGLDISYQFLLMAVPVTVLASMAPITPSGVGVREATWMLLLQPYGVPQEKAIVLGLMWFAVCTTASLFGGPVFLFFGKPRRSAEAPTPPQND